MKTHLRVLQILFYIYGVLTAAFLVFIFGAFCIQAFNRGIRAENGFLLLACVVLYAPMTALNIYAARHVGRATRRRICIWAAALNVVPFLSCCYWSGLPLGIYGLVILLGAEARIVFQRVEAGWSLEEAIADRKLELRHERMEDAEELDVSGNWDEAGKEGPRKPPPPGSAAGPDAGLNTPTDRKPW